MVKKRKANWEEEFDNEKNIYKARAPLQETAVPEFYGEAKCVDGVKGASSRALVLSNVDSIQLNQVPRLNTGNLKDMLSSCLAALARLKVGHGDPKLDNFLLVGGRVMAIDFDSAYMMNEEDPDREV